MRHADLATHASLASLFIKPYFTSAAICGASVAEGPTPTRHSSDCRFNTAARGAHRVGSWGLALGSEPVDQELAIDHSSPGLATHLHWREGDSSQPAYLS